MMLGRVVILIVLGFANVILFIHMMWGATGVMEYFALRRQLQDAQQQVADLDQENAALSNEIRWLQSDPKYLEKMIRQRLHYVRPNEVLYLFNEKVSPTSGEEKE